MAASPVFELFENVCAELATRPVQTISEDDLDPGLLEDLKLYFDETSDAAAYKNALAAIEAHFGERDASLPYSVSLELREFQVADPSYIEFVASARANRSVGGAGAKEFEAQTLRRLRTRLTGDLRRVGQPRDRRKTRLELVAYLQQLGFERNVLQGNDKDGGLDILWLPPLGAVPLRPVVSLQCKNAFFNEDEANASVGRASRTLSRHSHLRSDHLKFVVFNDYIDRDRFQGRAAGWPFIPLGLTDLAHLAGPGVDDIL